MSQKHLKTGEANPPVNPDVLRIYNMRYCPFAQRALLVLAAKGIQHEVVNCNLTEKPEFLLEKNPAGKVPVLEYKGQIIPESLVICDLIEDLFPGEQRLTATDPYQKARDRLAIDVFGQMISAFYKYGRKHDDLELEESLNKKLKEIEAQFTARQTPYFYGEQCGMVDFMVWPWVERLMALSPAALDGVPALKAWCGRMETVPAVKTCAVPAQEMRSFYDGYLKGAAIYD